MKASNTRRFSMKWETPQAIDLRFGMEITMYIANR
jgi:coenzyme PQQ precursor peptide PqqA